MKIYIALISLFFLIACASTPRFEADKIRPWSDDLAKTEAFHEAYVAEFTKKDLHLSFIAARHGNDINNATMKLVKKAIENQNLRLVLIEGLPYELGVNPSSFLYQARMSLKNTFIEGGEPAYSALLADSNNISFLGAEPSEKEILVEFKKSQFDEKDLVGFYVVRQFPQWLRQKKLETTTLEKTITQFLTSVCQDFEFSSSQCLTYKSFKDWYKNTNKKDFGSHFDSEEAAPFENGIYKTQQISAVVGKIRDYYILKHIEENLSLQRKILVVYRASHLLTLLPALESTLGKPEFYQ
jgi:hypothetical protein